MKRENIINSIVKEVRAKIENHLANYNRNLYFEKELGGCLIVVDITVEQICNGYYVQNTEVDIQHADEQHQSPLLADAIKKALPDWLEVEEEIFGELRQSA